MLLVSYDVTLLGRPSRHDYGLNETLMLYTALRTLHYMRSGGFGRRSRVPTVGSPLRPATLLVTPYLYCETNVLDRGLIAS